MPRLTRLFAPVVGLAACAGCSRLPPEPTTETPTTEVAADPAARYDQTFAQVCSADGGDDQLPPPDMTVGGKATGPLREAVEREWPTIAMTDEKGELRTWTVTLETDLGPIEITLRPALAPNHCRNLIALTKVGYYDGLRFDRIVHQEAETPDGFRSKIDLVRFGCPAGTGDPGVGHLGYHLKSEFSDVKHEAGTVGFVREKDASSAGVRLYITLGPCPALDGNFTVVGTVTKGLDVVEKIGAGKLLPPDADETRELPERPTVIRRAVAKAN